MDTLTPRLRLSRPTPADADVLYAINADPRVWTHYPTLRHTDAGQSAAMLAGWIGHWIDADLGTWVVRLRETGEVIGYGGCTRLRGGKRGGGDVWNLGYRIAADHHGRGYATELAEAATARAEVLAPEVPVIAFLVAHNHASAAVAGRAGLTLRHRGPDAGNPDPSVERLVFADRPLSAAQLASTLR
ncbi:RimJ/RimL family protein N-acetyltransferase [Microbacterium resistens]|uniref:RimJ/RimL family protein N-acetyltransferase n=1 Tax=Microbacterium resistens TaxID=156977 RepID=A0ABU1SA50_9MICO|nr:GNAT family N-acetyltransferase [Microbacterium resistens]MDR6866485.1 RimJ/RimL family protein N-acetyltransferase [Microbacterium resistens]